MKEPLTFLFLLLLNLLSAQEVVQEQDSTALTSIHDLSFMVGEWKGEGWIMINRERKTFEQLETITQKFNGSVLVIDGIGYGKIDASVSRKIIHEAFGVISFNKKTNSMKMLSYSTAGGKMENDLTKIGYKKLQWSFKDERGGMVRFREDFSKEGQWIEKGDYSFDGKNWFPFFEMNLTKVNNSTNIEKQKIFGLQTTIYKVGDIEKAKKWYAQAFGVNPYFDQAFYVGFNIGGYELGLQPEEKTTTKKVESVVAYWGVEDIASVYQHLIKNGAIENEKPHHVGGDIITATIKDPWGNIIGIIYNPKFKITQ